MHCLGKSMLAIAASEAMDFRIDLSYRFNPLLKVVDGCLCEVSI
jgi:hypothetical protein